MLRSVLVKSPNKVFFFPEALSMHATYFLFLLISLSQDVFLFFLFFFTLMMSYSSSDGYSASSLLSPCPVLLPGMADGDPRVRPTGCGADAARKQGKALWEIFYLAFCDDPSGSSKSPESPVGLDQSGPIWTVGTGRQYGGYRTRILMLRAATGLTEQINVAFFKQPNQSVICDC